MLILTRRPGEIIKIGDDIEVMVMSTKGNQVRIGVKAPNNIDVHRQEIWQRIQDEKAKGKPYTVKMVLSGNDVFREENIRERLVPALKNAWKK